ncbi:MAG TPA: hypothetical protein VFE26_07575, partial [Trebonia sp.]|nr:hypothetical protein [Trebonia sp.]
MFGAAGGAVPGWGRETGSVSAASGRCPSRCRWPSRSRSPSSPRALSSPQGASRRAGLPESKISLPIAHAPLLIIGTGLQL